MNKKTRQSPLIYADWADGWRYGKIPWFAVAPMNRLLSFEEQKLFLYYISCKEGFRPSAIVIENGTGLAKQNIYRARASLADKGFIKIGDGVIEILWCNIQRLNAFVRDAGKQQAYAALTTDAEKEEFLRTVPQVSMLSEDWPCGEGT